MTAQLKNDASSIYYGVSYRKDRNKFRASIKINKINISLGTYGDELEAALAYDNAVKYYEIDRRLNFPTPEPENIIPKTRLIRLNKGYFAVVDEDLFDDINSFKWTAFEHGNTVYAVCSELKYTTGRSGFMHRYIMGNNSPMIDHANGNGLHNYRSNLRECTNSQNQQNRKKSTGCLSIFKGVTVSKYNKFFATIRLGNKTTFIGSFSNEIEAAKAYNEKAIALFGEFAKVNTF